MNYSEKLNKTVLDLKPSGIRKFFDVVATMPDCISLGVGEPDFVTPWGVRQAAISSIQKGYTAYTSNQGLSELREEISFYLKNRLGLSYDKMSEILVTVGASEAIDLSLRAVVSKGDEVLIVDPSYVSYAPNVLLVGGVPKPIVATSKENFIITKENLQKAITKKSKAIIIPFPNNPTGAVMTKEQLSEILPLIIKHDLIVITDEIYAELTFEGLHCSIASLEGMRERTIYIGGFSKSFAMTGWRVGFVCAPKELLSSLIKIHQYTIMCAPTVSQYAALEALKQGRHDDYEAVVSMKESYNMRRRFLIDAFRKMGLDCFSASGAFYVFPSVKKTGLTGEAFAEKLLSEQKVAVVPGSAFGDSGKNYIRCCYACSMEILQEAVKRIAKFVQENRG